MGDWVIAGDGMRWMGWGRGDAPCSCSRRRCCQGEAHAHWQRVLAAHTGKPVGEEKEKRGTGMLLARHACVGVSVSHPCTIHHLTSSAVCPHLSRTQSHFICTQTMTR